MGLDLEKFQSGTYDLVGDVVPFVGFELNLPFALATHHPLQISVACTRLAVDPTIFELGKVTLKEANLMLVGCTRDIGSRPLYGEVVVNSSLVDGGFRLGY